MKLRNKKTGEIVELKLIEVNDKYLEDHEVSMLNGEKLTLESLVNSFDDVKEPLIKDEKIRKAVRAWAEANRDVSQVMFSKDVPGKSYSYLSDTDSDARIQFNFVIDGELDTYEVYTIAELCGEEEE